MAIAHCWLGSTVGAWYYAVFPISASAGLVAATTGAMLAAVGVVTALAWIVLDPLLATTGMHRRRLDRFVTALGEELRGRRGAYRVRDHYLARVLLMCWICCEAPPKRSARRLFSLNWLQGSLNF